MTNTVEYKALVLGYHTLVRTFANAMQVESMTSRDSALFFDFQVRILELARHLQSTFCVEKGCIEQPKLTLYHLEEPYLISCTN